MNRADAETLVQRDRVDFADKLSAAEREVLVRELSGADEDGLAIRPAGGVFDYRAGVNGQPVLPANFHVRSISAVGGAGGGTITINGGDAIPVVEGGVFDERLGDEALVTPVIVFSSGISAFYVGGWR